MTEHIPLVDFGACGVTVPDDDVTDDALKKAGDTIVQAFSTVGFCYITGSGISDSYMNEFRAVSRRYFEMPVSFKQKCAMTKVYHGWTGMSNESTNPDRPGDLKESFNFLSFANWGDWPEGELPEFKQACNDFNTKAMTLGQRLLKAVTLGMSLPKDNEILRQHSGIGNPNNDTGFRTLYYPPIMDTSGIKPNQVRLGEHFDFGSLTLLFQDNIGGLEACHPDGQYVPATPIPETVLINIGEMMQRWTADKLIATKHRVMIPEDTSVLKTPRQSVAVFILPNDDTTIKCIDGSDRYPPVRYKEHLQARMEAISKSY